MMEQPQKYELTHPQQRIWYTEKLHPGTGMWNNAGTLKIKGRIDFAVLERALNIFLEENESIRLRIGLEKGEPYQYVSPYEPYRAEVLDFSHSGIEKLYEWDRRQTKAPMPMIDTRLYYFAFLSVNPSECGLYAKFHHIISDAISIVEFSNQVMENYHRLLTGETPENTNRPSYVDYIAQEQAYLQSKRYAYDRDYWTRRFEVLPEPTILKPKKTNDLRTEAQRKVYVLNESFSDRVREYCVKTGISVFALFLSALAIYINRVTGKNDVIIGAPVANRSTLSEKAMFGMFVSMVPVRIGISDELSFTEFSQIVSNEWFSALKHQKYPFDVLMHELHQTHKNLESLYDVTLSYQFGKFHKNSGSFTYEGRWHFSGSQASALNIHVNDREDEGRFILDYDHHTPLFYDKEIEYFHDHLVNIIRDMIRHPDKPLYLLDLMSEEERKRVLHHFNDTQTEFPKEETLADLLHHGFSMNPDAPAVVCAGKTMTYRELDERSDALAAYLQSCGVRANSIVGLVVGRDMDYCIAVTAVIKAGGAFLPIDTELPADRIAYMVSDSGASILLASPEHAHKCPESGIRVIRTDIKPEPTGKLQQGCAPESLAYVIYTSGSTGQPKGVMIEQRAIVHFAYSMKKIWNLSADGRLLCAASISFDISVMEVVLSFTYGLTLVLAQEHEVAVPRNMANLIQSERVNMMVVTPGRIEMLLSDRLGRECIADFREIGLGGDVLSEKLLASVQQNTRARITNFYGPTEITICCTCIDVTQVRVPSIGRPMPDVRAYILDAHRNPVPIGVPGELYIGGPGVGRGYIGKPELTAERFIDDPYTSGAKLYRTGDLARWYPQGEIEFLGRMDKQVKIRGYRIELGEIENRILKVPGVVSCAVTDHTDPTGRRFLCAYLCGNPPRNADIKAQLARDLPSYMIPSIFITLESLPFNISGKVDRNSLPDPMAYLEVQKEDYQAPETVTEQLLAEIWSSELGLVHIGRNDSFFDLGGDSLSILRVMTQIEQQFHLAFRHEDIYRSPRLCDMAEVIDAAEQSSYMPILPAPKRRDYPVSSAQQRMWVVAQAGADSVAYNVPAAFEIKGNLDVKRLEAAFRGLISRHEALRTLFVLHGTNLRQRIHKNVGFKLETLHSEKRALKGLLKSLIKPFDMASAPLMRAILIELAPKHHVLFIDLHHSVCDQRSMEIMLSDLAALYRGEKLPPVALTYKDYAVWQQDFMQSDNMNLQREYWKSVLAGELPLLNLHTDRPRPAVQHFEGARYAFHINKETTETLRTFAQRYGGTLFMAMLAAYNVLMMKVTGQEDVIIGTPTSGRTREELHGMTGVLINTLPIRCFPHANQSFADFFGSVTKTCAAAFSNEDCPLERMIADIGLPRDYSRNPLFDTMLIVAKNSVQVTLGDVHLSALPFDPGFAKLDITLEAFERSEGLDCSFEYNKRLFKRSTIQRIADHFCRLTALLPEAPEACIGDVQMMSQQEIWQVTQGFNQTDYPLNPDQSIQSIFESQAALRPDKPALIVNGESITFNKLNQRANAIACLLRERGVERNTVVALNLKRSFDLIAAMFGVLKAGGGYLPLDISYPADRVTYMLNNSGTKILLTDGSSEIPFDGEVILVTDIQDNETLSNLDRIDRMDDIAYVMYTSGSTGLPKGTVLHRRGLLNLYEGVKGPVDYDAAQTSISITTVSFDIFICDAIMPLLYGSTVVLCTEDELRQPHMIAGLIEKYDVKFIQATPTRMSAMMEVPAFRSAMASHIENIMVGGEMVPFSLVKQLRKYCSARIINAYGPTETTVWSTFKELTRASRVTIGKPIRNTRIYILDKNRRPLPVGVLGEAYISGFGVAKGYINRDELNHASFIPDPFWPGQTMYKTGDLCVFLKDGDMEMCGRADHQVKIRGLRIEMGEIETTIRTLKGVEEAVVKDWGTGAEKYLCAYYVADDEVDSEAIRAHLSKKLPLYMIPSFFVRMDELPTTLNGKLNRKALVEPHREAIQGSQIALKDISENEKKMARIWSHVLKVKDVGPEDNFFTLGGDSLGVIKVQAAVLQFGWSLRTQDFYDFKTLRKICARIDVKDVPDRKVKHPFSKMEMVPAFTHLRPVSMKNVLLTGATGYLGAHILELLAREKDTHISCIVRGQDQKSCEQSLKKVLIFYFGAKTCDEIMKHTLVIQGDIAQRHFGMDESMFKRLKHTDALIHCAALTDHIGQSSTFTQINIDGTRNAADISRRLGASLIHISTISVSGTKYTDDENRKGIFTENHYDVKQNYGENEYVKSKFIAEGIVLDAMKKGLNARIFRVGVLTSTFKGRFQIHAEKNAFANRVKAICAIGCVPLSMLNKRIEMTPVDACAKAIITLSAMKNALQPVYHVYNTNLITIAQLVNYLESTGNTIEIVSDQEFRRILIRLSRSGQYTALSGLFEDLTFKEGENRIQISAESTVESLSEAGYQWPVIDTYYVKRYIESIY